MIISEYGIFDFFGVTSLSVHLYVNDKCIYLVCFQSLVFALPIWEKPVPPDYLCDKVYVINQFYRELWSCQYLA